MVARASGAHIPPPSMVPVDPFEEEGEGEGEGGVGGSRSMFSPTALSSLASIAAASKDYRAFSRLRGEAAAAHGGTVTGRGLTAKPGAPFGTANGPTVSVCLPYGLKKETLPHPTHTPHPATQPLYCMYSR